MKNKIIYHLYLNKINKEIRSKQVLTSVPKKNNISHWLLTSVPINTMIIIIL